MCDGHHQFNRPRRNAINCGGSFRVYPLSRRKTEWVVGWVDGWVCPSYCPSKRPPAHPETFRPSSRSFVDMLACLLLSSLSAHLFRRPRHPFGGEQCCHNNIHCFIVYPFRHLAPPSPPWRLWAIRWFTISSVARGLFPPSSEAFTWYPAQSGGTCNVVVFAHALLPDAAWGTIHGIQVPSASSCT